MFCVFFLMHYVAGCKNVCSRMYGRHYQEQAHDVDVLTQTTLKVSTQIEQYYFKLFCVFFHVLPTLGSLVANMCANA